jgi:hypothetical protein
LIATALSVIFMPFSAALIVALTPENADRTEWQTGPWRPSTQLLAASACRHS